jgi:hypothetical protein
MKGGVKMKSKKLSYNKILVLFSIILVSVLMTGCNEPIVLDFSASPSTINPGQSSTLTRDVSEADTVYAITPGVGTVASSGSTSVSPAVTTTYTLIATNSAGSTTASVTVTVIEELPDLAIIEIAFDPRDPLPEGEVTIRATIRNEGNAPGEEILVIFMVDQQEFARETISHMEPGREEVVTATWRATTLGGHALFIEVDPEGRIRESNEENNILEDVITVGTGVHAQ